MFCHVTDPVFQYSGLDQLKKLKALHKRYIYYVPNTLYFKHGPKDYEKKLLEFQFYLFAVNHFEELTHVFYGSNLALVFTFNLSRFISFFKNKKSISSLIVYISHHFSTNPSINDNRKKGIVQTVNVFHKTEVQVFFNCGSFFFVPAGSFNEKKTNL